MKKIFTFLILLLFIPFLIKAQGKVQASIGIGDAPNRVKIYLKSDLTETSNFSDLYFNIAVPASETIATPILVSAASSIPWEIDPVKLEGGYNNFSIYTALIPINLNLTAGEEFEVMELEIPGTSVIPASLSLITLPKAGSNGRLVFFASPSPSSDGSNLYYSRTDATYRTDVINGFSYNADGTQGTDISSATLIAKATPVKLSSFSVTSKNNDALLNWSVENQDANASHFEIERSANGSDFIQVGTVSATANAKESYSYSDDNVQLFGTVYYRLKMVDKDGEFAYSDVKSVQFANAAFAVSVYPNPVQNLTKLKVSLDEAQVIKVSVNNALGNIVQQFEIAGQKGINEKSLDLSSVPAGSYMIRIQAGQNRKTLSVIKN
jgi:hypothetical protein